MGLRTAWCRAHKVTLGLITSAGLLALPAAEPSSCQGAWRSWWGVSWLQGAEAGERAFRPFEPLSNVSPGLARAPCPTPTVPTGVCTPSPAAQTRHPGLQHSGMRDAGGPSLDVSPSHPDALREAVPRLQSVRCPPLPEREKWHLTNFFH